MRRTLIVSAALLVGASLFAQNPIIKGQYTADPTARVFNGKVYLFPSHDIISPVEPERKWFCMEDYHVFSSEDLVNWTDHGVILNQKDVPWGNPTGYSMWAPDCVEKDGKYYFYFSPSRTVPRDRIFLSRIPSKASTASTPACFRPPMPMPISSGVTAAAPSSIPA